MTGITPRRTDSTALQAGSVAVDIGAGYGALIVHGAEERLGEEIEVTRCADGARTHVGFRLRQRDGRAGSAAVFGSLAEGRYLLGSERLQVEIQAGAVTELTLGG